MLQPLGGGQVHLGQLKGDGGFPVLVVGAAPPLDGRPPGPPKGQAGTKQKKPRTPAWARSRRPPAPSPAVAEQSYRADAQQGQRGGLGDQCRPEGASATNAGKCQGALIGAEPEIRCTSCRSRYRGIDGGCQPVRHALQFGIAQDPPKHGLPAEAAASRRRCRTGMQPPSGGAACLAGPLFLKRRLTLARYIARRQCRQTPGHSSARSCSETHGS
jgi:hypothetical protein